VVSGGGAYNPLILAQLSAALPGIEVLPSSQLGIPEDAKEAFAFALLAYEAFHQRPANLPSATGACGPPFSVKSLMPHRAKRLASKLRFFFTSLLPYVIASFGLVSCSSSFHSDPSSLTFLIESSSSNLDPRFATDSQSQRH